MTDPRTGPSAAAVPSPATGDHPADLPGDHPAEDRSPQPTQAGTPIPPSAPGPLIVPARSLTPSPGRDRVLRGVTTAVGAATVLLVILTLALLTTATWLAGRGFADVPATTGLGSPDSLSLTSGSGSVRVLPSADVDELTIALVEPGETALPAADARATARVTESARNGAASVQIQQPARSFGPFWSDGRKDVLVLVPSELELDLDVRTDVGDVQVDGEYTALEAHSDAGDLRLGPITAPDGVSASSEVGSVDIELASPAPTTVDVSASVGDVDLMLPTDAAGRITITADIGDVEVAVPGIARWEVRAESELGDVSTAPGIDGGGADAAGTLTVTSDIGSIRITR